MRIRIRLDRAGIIPNVGELLFFREGRHAGHWKVIECQHEVKGWDPINDQIYISAVELELERWEPPTKIAADYADSAK